MINLTTCSHDLLETGTTDAKACEIVEEGGQPAGRGRNARDREHGGEGDPAEEEEMSGRFDPEQEGEGDGSGKREEDEEEAQRPNGLAAGRMTAGGV